MSLLRYAVREFSNQKKEKMSGSVELYRSRLCPNSHTSTHTSTHADHQEFAGPAKNQKQVQIQSFAENKGFHILLQITQRMRTYLATKKNPPYLGMNHNGALRAHSKK